MTRNVSSPEIGDSSGRRRWGPKPQTQFGPDQEFNLSDGFQQRIMPNSLPTGTFSTFDSPGKKQLPSLRAPNSQPFLFNQPRQPTETASVFGQPAFMTPRKVDVDFSSGAETSPENADAEDTPEQPTRTEKGSSLFQMYGRFAPSPGRGQIPRASHYSNAVVHKIQKRKQRDKAPRRRVRVDSDDDSDRPSSGEGRNKSLAQTKGPTDSQPPASRISSFGEFFSLLEAHPNVPGILSWWAQLLVNLSLFSLAVYVVFTFVSAIRAEFEQAAEEVSDTILAEMATCAKSYVENKCGGDGRLPALETVCENWERCMNRDPAKVGRAKVSAHTMALIINSFIDPISWKAIVGTTHFRSDETLTFLALLPRNHLDLHRRQQLVLPLLQKPLQPASPLTTLQPTAGPAHAWPAPPSPE